MTPPIPPQIDATCPNPRCQKKLKVAAGRPERVLTCPLCQTQFQVQMQVSSMAMPVIGAATPPVATRLPASAMPAAAAPPAARPARRRDEDEDLENDTRSESRPASAGSSGKHIVFLGLLFLTLAFVGFGAAYALFRKPAVEKVASGQKLGLYGGVEIGSKGVKAVVVDLSLTAEGYDYDLKYEKTADLSLGKLMKGDSEFDPKALDEAVIAAKGMVGTMTKSHGLTPERIVIVASSGLFTKFSSNDSAVQGRDLLAKRLKEATGIELDTVDSNHEARYATLTCVPPKERGNTLLIDIGSGNTKGGYFEDSTTFTSMELDLGTSTYSEKLAENMALSPRVRKQPEEIRKNLLIAPLMQEVDRKPGLKSLNKVYLIGGTPWAMTTYTHANETASSRVRLTSVDITEYRNHLKKPSQELVAKELAVGKESADEFSRVQSRFKVDQLQGGSEILQALSEVYALDRKELTFFRKGQFAWIVGYIIDRAGIESADK